jgi:hypothetical protein
MTQPEPPLARVTQRIADTAKGMVGESADVVFAESKTIDGGDYKMKDAIDTVTKLVGIGITGAARIGRITIEEKPPDTVMAMGEYIASVLRRMVSQTGTVAQDASNHVDAKAYTPSKWLESVTRLIDIGIAGGMEIVETVDAGPATNGETRTLVPGSLKRDATNTAIETYKISFDPPTLVPPNAKFTILINASDLVSGIYEGDVTAEYADRKAPDVTPGPDVVHVSVSL